MFTENLDVEKPQEGDQRGTWGGTANTNYDKLDASISRVLSLNIVSNQLLTTSQSAVSTFNSRIISLTGDISSLTERSLEFPENREGAFIIDTSGVTFGNNGIRVKTENPADTGIVLNQGTPEAVEVFTNGVNVRRVGQNATDTSSNFPVIGEIRMYVPPGGTINTSVLPVGWHVADGTNGTVDLRDQFIKGWTTDGPSGDIGDTGGSPTANVSININGSVGDTVLTTDQMPSHTHFTVSPDSQVTGGTGATTTNTASVANRGETGSGNDFGYAMLASVGTASQGLTSTTGGALPHTHTFSGTTGTATVNTEPAFFRVVFIQFTNA
jgi:hypothetical protein